MNVISSSPVIYVLSSNASTCSEEPEIILPDRSQKEETTKEDKKNTKKTKKRKEKEKKLEKVKKRKQEKDTTREKQDSILRKSKEKRQVYTNIIQVRTSLTENTSKTYVGCIPIFMMCGLLDSLIPENEETEELSTYLLLERDGRIVAMVLNYIHPGIYLLTGLSTITASITDVNNNSGVSSKRFVLKKATLSPYLSSPFEPVSGQHFVMTGNFQSISSTCTLSDLNTNEAIKILEEELEESNGCGNDFLKKDENFSCDSFYYFLMMSEIEKDQEKQVKGKKKFRMRILFEDEAMRKRKIAREKLQKAKKDRVTEKSDGYGNRNVKL